MPGALWGCEAPFEALSATPLRAVAANYLSLFAGLLPRLLGGTGSALIVAPGLVVTNAHVARMGRRLRAFSPWLGVLETRLVATSDRLDLAVLRLSEPSGRPLPVAEARRGEPVWAMGTTSGRVAPVALGWIENERAWSCLDMATTWAGRLHAQPAEPFAAGLMYAADGGPGYSGGPVVNAKGEVVGITQGIYTRFFDAPPRGRRGMRRMFAYHVHDVLAEAARLVGSQAGL